MQAGTCFLIEIPTSFYYCLQYFSLILETASSYEIFVSCMHVCLVNSLLPQNQSRQIQKKRTALKDVSIR